MVYTTLDILQFWKDFQMLARLLIDMIILPQVVGFLILVEELFHGA